MMTMITVVMASCDWLGLVAVQHHLVVGKTTIVGLFIDHHYLLGTLSSDNGNWNFLLRTLFFPLWIYIWSAFCLLSPVSFVGFFKLRKVFNDL